MDKLAIGAILLLIGAVVASVNQAINDAKITPLNVIIFIIMVVCFVVGGGMCGISLQ